MQPFGLAQRKREKTESVEPCGAGGEKKTRAVSFTGRKEERRVALAAWGTMKKKKETPCWQLNEGGKGETWHKGEN